MKQLIANRPVRAHGICAPARIAIFFAVVGFLTCGVRVTHSQLAITEVMSSATDRLGTNLVAEGPDFWELTNYSTNQISLTGYGFNDDSTGWNGRDTTPFSGVFIDPNESIILIKLETNAPIAVEMFRRWWGLSDSVQVLYYQDKGFKASGDGVRLWSPSAAEDLVDSVNFGVATDGVTFTYNPATGAFDGLSAIDVGGAFKAVTADDVGSPGVRGEPFAISIVESPASVLAIPGDSVTFRISFRGLPRPSFQWFHNGNPIPGARSTDYTISSVSLAEQGDYQVVLSNSLGSVTSAAAALTVRTNPVAPQFVVSPTDFHVFEGQGATFQAVAVGLSPPTYQWRFNGADIAGATNRSYVLQFAQFSDAGIYSVVASNQLGAVTNEARLVVTARPNLKITEIMPGPTTGHQDWWELTNFEDYPVDLIGFRFDDLTRLPAKDPFPLYAYAWVVTNHVIIGPEESIVFVEQMDAGEFRDWWGSTNLPPALQIIRYGGLSLNLDADGGDGIGLFNMGATDDRDLVILGSFSSSPPGISLVFDVTNPDVDCCYLQAEAGVNGAFAAAQGGDVGSPGYIDTPTDPRILLFRRQPAGCFLTWRSIRAGNYVVQCRDRLAAGNWVDLATRPRAGATTSFLDTTVTAADQRFYRVVWRPTP